MNRINLIVLAALAALTVFLSCMLGVPKAIFIVVVGAILPLALLMLLAIWVATRK